MPNFFKEPPVPDQFCPDMPPVRKSFNILDGLGDWGDILFGPSSGTSVQGTGAGAIEGAGAMGP